MDSFQIEDSPGLILVDPAVAWPAVTAPCGSIADWFIDRRSVCGRSIGSCRGQTGPTCLWQPTRPALTLFTSSARCINKKSAHLTTAERCTLLINLWLTAIYSMFDRLTADSQADRQTERQYNNNSWTLHCSNWLECLSARTKFSRFNYFTIISTPLCVSRWQLLCQTYCCIAPDSGWL